MDIQDVRQTMRFKSIFDMPLRVTYYARVSTEKDEQLNSLENQVTYYKEFITQKKAWTYVPGYVDEGISGISTKNRNAFNKMISDSSKGKFDLIVTKEISRFARNTLDSIQYTRELAKNNVGVYFQNDGINTFDDDAELRLTIMASIAQDELRKLSSRIKFGHQQAIKSHVVLGNSNIFGYKKDNKRLVIDEAEAKMVKELFELYATDKYSMKQIETLFWDKGYRNHNGNKIAHGTMSGIISNPKYKGYYVGNKVQVIDMFTKKQKFLSQDKWVMFKDETGEIVPAIVDEDVWDRANEVLTRRSNDVKKRRNTCNHPNLLTGKLFCTHCGRPYYRKDVKNPRTGEVNPRWVCSGKINNGASSCPSFAIYESELKEVLLEAFKDIEVDMEALCLEYTEKFKEITESEDIQNEILSCEDKIKLNQDKLEKLLELNIHGKMSDEQFISMSEKCDRENKELKMKITEMEKELLSKDDLKTRLDEIKKVILDAQKQISTKEIDKVFVNQFVDKIYATSLSDDTMSIEIKLLTGKTKEKQLNFIKNRTGNTSKKMIESYEEK